MESSVDKNANTYPCRVPHAQRDPGTIDVRARGDTVTIRRESKPERIEKDVDFHGEEITCGSCEGSFALPEGVDTDEGKVEHGNGVLELTAPVAAAWLPSGTPAKTGSKRIAA